MLQYFCLDKIFPIIAQINYGTKRFISASGPKVHIRYCHHFVFIVITLCSLSSSVSFNSFSYFIFFCLKSQERKEPNLITKMLIWWSSTFFMGFFHHSEIQYWLKFRKSYSQKPNVWWNYYMVEMSLCDFFLWNPKWLLSQLEKLFFSPTTEPFERNHVLVGALSVFILSNNIAIG